MANKHMTKRRSSRNVTFDLNALCEEFNVSTAYDKAGNNRGLQGGIEIGVQDLNCYPKRKLFQKRKSTKMDLNALCKEFGVDVKEELDIKAINELDESISPRPGTRHTPLSQRMSYLEDDDASADIECLVADLEKEQEGTESDKQESEKELVFRTPMKVDNKFTKDSSDSESDFDDITVMDSILQETNDVAPDKTQ